MTDFELYPKPPQGPTIKMTNALVQSDTVEPVLVPTALLNEAAFGHGPRILSYAQIRAMALEILNYRGLL